ncbi:hypothetical protein BU251_08355 [Candidatus Velamenicoccus archaeovorus]|uniref:Uncharacterized protein n=1 Tax=Velamenicoccus archaeovorus TaxID=1930593 RepID=A0A410P6B9_VELA1|nr:hypothetical protein BU251_08355 [Candidatus Velamenicoccus archaeovorus]
MDTRSLSLTGRIALGQFRLVSGSSPSLSMVFGDFGRADFSRMQGATTMAYPLWYVEEEQRSRRSKDAFPLVRNQGAGRFWAATASFVLGVALWLRQRPLSLSRSKIVTAKTPMNHR